MTSAAPLGAAARPALCRPDDAVARIEHGATVMVGGFGLVGAPLTLIDALCRSTATDLTVISNNLGEPGRGLGRLVPAGRVRKAVGSYFTSNPDVVRAHADGHLEIDLLPQGTLAEAIRAGGAGIGGFYTQTGLGTLLAQGREERVLGGERYLLQESLRADVALIRARTADELGNLTYAKTARNFNPDMATAARLVIAEVDEIVPVGTLDPEAVVTPHLYVDMLVLHDPGTGATR
jgi:3-oxoacid CoA-transferase subunit A/3-oxoadipate CoA-transferase alpha subunit